MGKQVFIAEKPSVAREFANALGLDFRSRDGYMEAENTYVTWCVGHLVSMSYPDAYDPSLKRWSLSTIPFIPDSFRYQVIDGVKKQFGIVKKILTDPQVDTIYICTDSGREGEYIYRLVAQEAGVRGKDQKRVWIDSQTKDEILRGIREKCGPDFILSVRHSAAEGSLEECCAIADLYAAAGADYLQISDGIGPSTAEYPEGYPYNRVCWMGIQVHEYMRGKVPVSVVNGILTPDQARALIDGGLADTVDSARALLADPAWARAVTDGADCVPCRNCRVCFWSPFMPHRCPAVKQRHDLDPDCCDYDEDDRPIPDFAKRG